MSEEAPFDEALKILADLIAEKCFSIQLKKVAEIHRSETTPLPASDVSEENARKEN